MSLASEYDHGSELDLRDTIQICLCDVISSAGQRELCSKAIESIVTNLVMSHGRKEAPAPPSTLRAAKLELVLNAL